MSMKKLSKLTLCAFLLSVSTASIAESRLVVWEDNGKGYGIEKAARNFAKEMVVKLLSNKRFYKACRYGFRIKSKR